jgi:hypothetical protein
LVVFSEGYSTAGEDLREENEMLLETGWDMWIAQLKVGRKGLDKMTGAKVAAMRCG